jgi:hypothetical protein
MTLLETPKSPPTLAYCALALQTPPLDSAAGQPGGGSRSGFGIASAPHPLPSNQTQAPSHSANFLSRDQEKGTRSANFQHATFS